MSNVLRKKPKSNNPPAIQAAVLAHRSSDRRRHGELSRSLFSRVISFFSRNAYVRHYCSHLTGGYPDTVSNRSGCAAGN